MASSRSSLELSEATSGTELPAVAAPDEEAPAVPPAVLSRRLTLQIYTDLEEKSEKTAWLRPRLLLGAVSFTLCVFGGLLQNDPAIFVGADFVTMQNPSFAFSKDTLLNIFGEIVAVPSAAVFSTVLLLTLLEVYAEKLGFPLLNSDARNIADGRAVTLGAILTVHSLWIIILGGARFGDEAPGSRVVRSPPPPDIPHPAPSAAPNPAIPRRWARSC